MYLLRTLIDSVSQPYLYILGTTQCTLLMGAVVQPCNPLSLPLYTQTCPDFRCGFETNLHQKPALSAVAHSSCRQPTVANSSPAYWRPYMCVSLWKTYRYVYVHVVSAGLQFHRKAGRTTVALAAVLPK